MYFEKMMGRQCLALLYSLSSCREGSSWPSCKICLHTGKSGAGLPIIKQKDKYRIKCTFIALHLILFFIYLTRIADS